MQIDILGTGCPKCKETEKVIKKAIEKMEIDATVEKVEDIEKIIEYGVMSTPAVAIDGEVVISGHVPSEDEIVREIKKHG